VRDAATHRVLRATEVWRPARASGREQHFGPGSGSKPGGAHGPHWKPALRAASNGRHKAPSAVTREAFTGSGSRRDGSDGGTSLLLAAVFRRVVVIQAPIFDDNHRGCRGSPRGVSRFRRNLKIGAKNRSRNHSSVIDDHASKLSRVQRTERPGTGRRRPSTWRERPRPWPQEWQAKSPFCVVAHATAALKCGAVCR
jgi:hypothetical protein